MSQWLIMDSQRYTSDIARLILPGQSRRLLRPVSVVRLK